MDTYPITASSLEIFFQIDGDQFERQYKEHLSGYRSWNQLAHADKWLLFPENIGTHMSIDETSLSNGELYTVLINKEAHGGKGAIVAIIAGVNADTIIPILNQISEE